MTIICQRRNRCSLCHAVDVERGAQAVNQICQQWIADDTVADAQTCQGISLGESPQQDKRFAAGLNQTEAIRVLGLPLRVFVIGLIKHQQTLRGQCVEQLLQLVGA
ncbi:hypothetical protein D3C76_824740 [compost metagenome]